MPAEVSPQFLWARMEHQLLTDSNFCASCSCVGPLPHMPGCSSEYPGLKFHFKGRLLLLGLFLIAIGSTLNAQELRYAVSQPNAGYYQNQTYSPTNQLAGSRQPLSTGQLEQLVAPIALYADALVAQILAASTYPQEVREADQWRHDLADASPEQVAADADAQPWDPSVKALTAFPQVLERMDRNIQWTSDLGNAYYNQPEDVLEAVQVMRRRAQLAGNLQSTTQEVVRYNADYIELAPVNPQLVYVPAYNPWTVYGEPIDPYPGFNLFGVLGDIFGATPLRYGLGMAMSAFTGAPWGWLAWGLNWLTHALLFDNSNYYSHSNSVADWGFRNTGFHAYAGRGGFGRSGFDHGGMHGEGWRRGGYGNGGWHSFARGNTFARNRTEGWHSFERRNTFAGNNWRRGSNGFQSFRNSRADRSYERGFGNRLDGGRTTYASNFRRAPNTNFRESRFGNGYGAKSSGSHFGSRSSSFREPGRAGHSGGMRMFGGHSQRSSGNSWGGFHSHGGGGHASKSFGGGRGFGGGHSGGGHSGGHGGDSRHHH